MKFGSSEMFEFIESHISDENDYLWYEELFRCIYSDAKMLLSNDPLSKEDVEDIIQEAQIAVSRNLVAFVEDSKNKTEKQRNAWLKTIVINKRNDFFRKSKKFRIDSIDGMDKEFPDIFNTTEKAMQKVELAEAIKKVSQINSSPDRLLAFILNKLSSVSSETNGKPSTLAEELYGRALKDIFLDMREQLLALFQDALSDDIFKPLWDRVEPKADMLFELSAKSITDSSSEITKKMKRGSDL